MAIDYGKKGYKIALIALVFALIAFSIGGVPGMNGINGTNGTSVTGQFLNLTGGNMTGNIRMATATSIGSMNFDPSSSTGSGVLFYPDDLYFGQNGHILHIDSWGANFINTNLSMGGKNIINCANCGGLDNLSWQNEKVNKSGDNMTGELNMSNNNITKVNIISVNGLTMSSIFVPTWLNSTGNAIFNQNADRITYDYTSDQGGIYLDMGVSGVVADFELDFSWNRTSGDTFDIGLFDYITTNMASTYGNKIVLLDAPGTDFGLRVNFGGSTTIAPSIAKPAYGRYEVNMSKIGTRAYVTVTNTSGTIYLQNVSIASQPNLRYVFAIKEYATASPSATGNVSNLILKQNGISLNLLTGGETIYYCVRVNTYGNLTSVPGRC